MDYKELLNRCRTKPGWLGTEEQKKIDSLLKYRAWVMEVDKNYADKNNIVNRSPVDTKKKDEPDFWSGSF